MTGFWWGAAILLALALALVLPGLLKTSRSAAPARNSAARQANLLILREQIAQLEAEHAAGDLEAGQRAQARADIERRVLEEESLAEQPAITGRASRTAALVSLAIPLLAVGMYGVLGNPQALTQPAPSGGDSVANAASGEGVTMAQIASMVDQLALRLESQPADQPADPKAWEMLARSYAAMQRFPEADRAYARAIALAPENAQLLADHADVLAMLQGQSAAGEPTRLIARALQLEPDNLKALALAGSAAFERQDFSAAAGYWRRALEVAPPDTEFAAGLARSLDDARAAMATSARGPSSSASPSESTASANGKNSVGSGAISGTASVAPALAGRVAPDDTVFIFARAATGPRMPLAIVRRKASELPIRFTLDDSSAMSPEFKLSSVAQVVVGVRVSRSGNATPQSGDLVGQSQPMQPGAHQAGGLALVIDSVQP